MSYSILHMQKMKRASVTGLQIHNERQKDSLTNPDIDREKTHLNYELHQESDLAYRTRIDNRISELELKRAVRKDATVCTGFVTTSDKEFFDRLSVEETKDFFKSSYEFLKDRYGEQNIISSKVHMDERTPHMHTYIVPVTEDNRLSARDLFSPKQLRELQDDFNKFVNDRGFELERGKIDTKRKHLTTEEFKIESKLEKLRDREKEIDNRINSLESERKSLQSDLKALENEFNRVQGISADFDEVNAIEGKYGLLGKSKITIKTEDFEKLKDIAKRQHVLERKILVVQNEKSSMKSDIKKFGEVQRNYLQKSMSDKKKINELEKKLNVRTSELISVKGYLTENNQLDDYRDFRKKDKQIQLEKIEKQTQKQMNKGFDLER